MLTTKSLYHVLVFIILLTGFAVRLIYVSQLEDKLWWVDEVDYMALGQSIAAGDGFVNSHGEATAFRPPGYPLLLAGLDKLGCDTVSEIRFAHVLFSTLTLFFLFLLSLKIAGPVAALVSIAVAAGYPYFVFGTGTLFAFTWFSFLLIVSVYFLVTGLKSEKKWQVALAGFLMGVAILTRTSAAVLGMMTLLWLLIVLMRTPKKFFITAFIYGAMMTLVVSPWLIRNYITFGKPVLSTNGGRNLWLGNNPSSTINTGSDIAMPTDLEARIDAATEITADAIYTAEAMSFIKSNPMHYLRLTALKALAFWRFDPSPTTDGYPRYKNIYSMISILSYAPILFLAILAFGCATRDQKKYMLMVILFALSFSLVHAVYITKVRFRLPLDYFLIVMAGSAVASLFQRSALIKRLLLRFSPGHKHDQHSTTFSFPTVRHRQSL